MPIGFFNRQVIVPRVSLMLNVAWPKRIPQQRHPRNSAAPPECPSMQHCEAPGLCKDLGAIKRTSPKMLVHTASKPYPAAAHGSARSVTQSGYALAEGCFPPAAPRACGGIVVTHRRMCNSRRLAARLKEYWRSCVSALRMTLN